MAEETLSFESKNNHLKVTSHFSNQNFSSWLAWSQITKGWRKVARQSKALWMVKSQLANLIELNSSMFFFCRQKPLSFTCCQETITNSTSIHSLSLVYILRGKLNLLARKYIAKQIIAYMFSDYDKEQSKQLTTMHA